MQQWRQRILLVSSQVPTWLCFCFTTNTRNLDYCLRATDSKGNKLPTKQFAEALVVATGAGFTTTSSLLSWLIYGLVKYEGMQERLLQELIDNDFDENTQITAELTS